jgi:hypothetical protein
VSEGKTSLFVGAEPKKSRFPSEEKRQPCLPDNLDHLLLVYILVLIAKSVKKTTKRTEREDDGRS